MEILCSELFEKQLKDILSGMQRVDPAVAKDFKMYLDTLIINIPTKVKKYKQSVYLEDEKARDLRCQNYTVVFSIEDSTTFVILGIVEQA